MERVASVTQAFTLPGSKQFLSPGSAAFPDNASQPIKKQQSKQKYLIELNCTSFPSRVFSCSSLLCSTTSLEHTLERPLYYQQQASWFTCCLLLQAVFLKLPFQAAVLRQQQQQLQSSQAAGLSVEQKTNASEKKNRNREEREGSESHIHFFERGRSWVTESRCFESCQLGINFPFCLPAS